MVSFEFLLSFFLFFEHWLLLFSSKVMLSIEFKVNFLLFAVFLVKLLGMILLFVAVRQAKTVFI